MEIDEVYDGRPWTDEEIDQVLDMVKRGFDLTTISRDLNRPSDEVGAMIASIQVSYGDNIRWDYRNSGSQ